MEVTSSWKTKDQNLSIFDGLVSQVSIGWSLGKEVVFSSKTARLPKVAYSTLQTIDFCVSRKRTLQYCKLSALKNLQSYSSNGCWLFIFSVEPIRTVLKICI